MKAEIKVPIYGSAVTLIYDESFENHIPGYDPDEFAGDSGVTIFYLDSNRFILAIRPSAFSQASVTHETIHLTHRILECVGVKSSYLEDEVEAYLAGYLSQEIVNRIYEHEDSKFSDLRYMKYYEW